MLLTFRALICLLLCTLASQAQIIIYKGSSRAVGNTVAKAASAGSYILFNLSTNEYRSIDFNSSRSNKDKAYHVQEIDTTHSTTLEAVKSKSKTLLIPDSSFLNLGKTKNDFSAIVSTLQGTNAALQVGGEARAVLFPKLLTLRGIFIQSTADNAISFEVSGLVTFQAKLTVQENEAGHTLDEATDTIVQLLKKQGYTDAQPN